jgi:hypothetical protein
MAKSQPKAFPKPVPKPADERGPADGLKNYQQQKAPPRNALAQRLASEYKAKEMLTQDPTKQMPLIDEIGSRPAPAFNLGRFDQGLLGGSRRQYENWRSNARAPKVEFGGVATTIANRA